MDHEHRGLAVIRVLVHDIFSEDVLDALISVKEQDCGSPPSSLGHSQPGYELQVTHYWVSGIGPGEQEEE